ncbi:uncharacterized protein LOC121371135 [Gigantopelta aegis]|uniref:uncharacterized protein LOC121371135 n=1 Tax=Gigantopelta aegis TaxID=1735272 RepID=UPI001B8892C2|nr:uncharacterized protein LOC121371135 [Gigantopelta aegis]
MDICNVELCINKRDGSKQVFSQPAGKHPIKSDFKTLVNSLEKLQKEANAHLTVMVEKEKSLISISTNNCSKNTSGEMESDDDTEEDEDDETNGEPIEKKIKR